MTGVVPAPSGLAHFKRCVKRGERPRGACLQKSVIATASSINDRTFRFTISTANIDRDQDTISVTGWDLTAYLRNPVVLWAHGCDPTVGTWSIGRAFDVRPEGGVLRASVEFDPADMPVTGPAAEACVRKLRNGSLAATSVGFRPLDYAVSTDPDRAPTEWMPGIDFKKQELLEFSLVSVPANSEALVLQPAELDDVPIGKPPTIQAYHEAQRKREAAHPLPPAPVAGWRRPVDMTAWDKRIEQNELSSWVNLAKRRRHLNGQQRHELEFLTERLAVLARGFR